ncbi:MAG: hypothetical protein E6939_07845 [Escherichia coli]|nr:hypothetical protein [Escherichia coli]
MLALKIVHGMAREIAERVSYLRHECPHQCQPAKRVALRCFAELVLGTIEKLIAPKLKDNGSEYECSQEEKCSSRSSNSSALISMPNWLQ